MISIRIDDNFWKGFRPCKSMSEIVREIFKTVFYDSFLSVKSNPEM